VVLTSSFRSASPPTATGITRIPARERGLALARISEGVLVDLRGSTRKKITINI
jgi:hypothetical protein